MASPQPAPAADPGAQAPRADSVFSVMLRKSLPPAIVAGTLTAGVQWVVSGTGAAMSGLVGVLIAVTFFASALVVMARFVTDGEPLLFMAVGMTVYFAQVICLLGVLILARRIEIFDMPSAGIAMLVVVLVWQAAQVHAWRSARIPVYDTEDAPVDTTTRSSQEGR